MKNPTAPKLSAQTFYDVSLWQQVTKNITWDPKESCQHQNNPERWCFYAKYEIYWMHLLGDAAPEEKDWKCKLWMLIQTCIQLNPVGTRKLCVNNCFLSPVIHCYFSHESTQLFQDVFIMFCLTTVQTPIWFLGLGLAFVKLSKWNTDHNLLSCNSIFASD